MTSEKKLWMALIAVAIIAITGLFFPLVQSQFGANGTRFPSGVSADSTSPVAGELHGDDLTLDDDATVTDDVTINGGSLTVTTANTATSTAVVGCIQTYATSTATPVRLSATTTATGGTEALFVFGTCPF